MRPALGICNGYTRDTVIRRNNISARVFEMNEIISFGEWIKHRRKLMELTQAQLGQRVGCAAITIKKIENDERRPSQQVAELLAEHLAIPQPERAQFFSMARG